MRVVCAAASGAVLAGAAACGSPPAMVPTPTFPAAPLPTTTQPPSSDLGSGLPSDCRQLVGQDELPGLLGLPVGSIAVRTVLGVPAPSVGRVQRTDCSYTVTDPHAPPLGVVLRMTVGRYRDPATARDQHDRNVANEAVGASDVRPVDLGAAAATIMQRGGESFLLVSYGTLTVDLDLVRRAEPLPPEDLLTDLVRRVLGRLNPPWPDGAPGRPGRSDASAAETSSARAEPAP